MIIGVPLETKAQEMRVSLTPGAVFELVASGHKVLVERGAGAGIHEPDSSYKKAGARLVDCDTVFGEAQMIVKVKEPQSTEVPKLRKGQLLFTYLHLAANRKLTDALIGSGATCIAYETVTSPTGGLPLLTPMSRIAGRLAPQSGAQCLLSHFGGRGTLMSGGGGTLPANVLILGGGVVGMNAAMISVGMGARVVVMDKSLEVLERAEREIEGVTGVYSNKANVAEQVGQADVVIGAVLIPGASAPKLVSRKMLRTMRPGAVLVDVAIDQGGCFATSRPTTHHKPTYELDGIVHYCVANMPGAVPNTASHALNHATLPYVLRLAADARKALSDSEHLRDGLSVMDGELACKATARTFRIKHTDALKLLN